jgi:uncharacterized protein (DUF433 family)
MIQVLGVDYPFARLAFRTDGRKLWIDLAQMDRIEREEKRLIGVDDRGQFAWDRIIGPTLRTFEYGDPGIVVRWHPAGEDSPVIIDPRVAFGVSAVQGIPTWIIAGRAKAGEDARNIADDFRIDVESVRSALRFENVTIH